MLIAHIALPVPLYQLYDYRLTQPAEVGMRVKVPFGKRDAIGVIVSIDQQTDVPIECLKDISEIIDNEPLFTPAVWQLLNWAVSYYHFPIGEVIFHAMPVLVRQGKQASKAEIKQWQLTELGKNCDLKSLSRSYKQQLLLTSLKNNMFSENDFSANIFHQLEKKQLIKQVSVTPDTVEWQSHFSTNPTSIRLNEEQTKAIASVNQQNQQFNVFLLEGITGSGKTEVYLNILSDILSAGKQALILVPEIGLTPQTIKRFKQRFNAPIDILHSGLTDKQRFEVWLRSRSGENAIVVGTRSALFTPFKHLGMIIIDEEHDNSYKQQEGWRYHARDLAIIRAKIENIPIILGSATPSLETLNNAQNQKYQLLQLTQRAGDASLAQQSILDIRGLVLCAGLSQPLIDQIKKHLSNNNQVMLFLNRRGFSPSIICHDCGWIAECPRCDMPYTYHQKQHKLICHYCDTPRALPHQCPKCGSTHLIPIGFGTEQLEKQLEILFPNIKISRIDRDTVSKKGALDNYLKEIQQGGAHILVGTQILAKGHHFPDVTLVGIVDVDGALFSSDFRATERFAQIYTQVSGRAGREAKTGEVILQTYHPDHPLLNVLLSKGYQEFAKFTLQERRQTHLPPFSYQVMIRAADRNNHHAPNFLQQIHDWLKSLDDHRLWQLGPMPSNQPKKAGYYRWQLLLQHTHRQQLQQILDQLIISIDKWSETSKVRWSIDVDPIDN
ncbi:MULTISPECIES: primosomal protein N' [unclassified Gilliamella]|uniref:primosomal protein N' n=1 Tax=unclassified Gilliamella TaxID=2685620 RepID=UPI002269CC81|nr:MULTISPECIES: primosomal protein N' [unclassified Gilliamella]MCX8600328.1 primosomal protein N' [Gilliamella sp. B3722]MCX8609324.1 primosomal protein N' [Gilliamella sp. B3771]MCX8609543.1 primosomal protein N' [Gilliamella sp. B3891]MCX8612368.1 primosomal protein N' [Gilliamella sp. B3773]MCX8615788.1 primosomal protein N' [Gilliamella sp. B3770]